ncbi:MAG: hypothetical protein FD126_3639 [Elusimicrobia bacterium]|nr:MAG: hypothetical protein FD126_3639 [Elusimicrobiota bacterium]
MGLMARTLAGALASASAIPGTARIGPMEVMGFDGQMTTAVAVWIASSTPGAGNAVSEELLKAEPASGREDAGGHGGVRRGKDPAPHAERPADRVRDLGETLSRFEAFGPEEMGSEVPVPQVEPRLAAEGRHGGETAEGVVPDSPALRLVEKAGEGVGHGVEIRGDVKAPDARVVAGIADHRDLLGRNDGGEPSEELGGSGAAGERNYHAEAG